MPIREWYAYNRRQQARTPPDIRRVPILPSSKDEVMGKMSVFRFRYLDRATGEVRLAEDWATARAIADMGGVIEPESELSVDSAEVSATAGLLMMRKSA